MTDETNDITNPPADQAGQNAADGADKPATDADAQASAPETTTPDASGEPAQGGSDTEERGRRSKARPDVEMPTGYRSSRRGSRALKAARKQAREQSMLRVWDTTRRTSANVLWLIGMVLAALAIGVVVLWGAAWLINNAVRWNAKRVVDTGGDSERARKVRENLLVISEDATGKPTAFLAMRYDPKTQQVFGVAIPEGAFIEVPGQGFERLGDSLAAGPDVSAAAVSNYLATPFERYVIIPEASYQAALKGQDVTGLLDRASTTNLTTDELGKMKADFGKVPGQNVALVPLPVKPLKLGKETYFEPQRDEIADLLKTWWGVDITKRSDVIRAVVYNGAGEPGIAGKAAQALIKAGYRVVDTGNADRFDYATTKIIVQRGDEAVGEKVRAVLGVGEVTVQKSEQDVADVIVIVGKDYGSAQTN